MGLVEQLRARFGYLPSFCEAEQGICVIQFSEAVVALGLGDPETMSRDERIDAVTFILAYVKEQYPLFTQFRIE